MKNKNTVYTIRGNDWVEKTVPNTKQKQDNNTNNTIKCENCPTKTEKYLRIIDLVAMYEGKEEDEYVKGYVCYECGSRLSLYHDMSTNVFGKLYCYMDKDNNRITPQLITQGLGQWNNKKKFFRTDDISFSRQEELDSFRLASANRVKKGIVMSPKGKRKAQNDNPKDKSRKHDGLDGRLWLDRDENKDV